MSTRITSATTSGPSSVPCGAPPARISSPPTTSHWRTTILLLTCENELPAHTHTHTHTHTHSYPCSAPAADTHTRTHKHTHTHTHITNTQTSKTHKPRSQEQTT